MLYTYAIEPAVLVTWDKCRNTLNLMGFQHGRAIAGYPSRKGWKALVRTACRESETPERDRKRIFRKLDQSNAKLVRSDDRYDEALQPKAERWIRNAVAQQKALGAFHAILSTRNPEGHPDVVLEEDIDESHERLEVGREVPVLREPEALASHVGTLVRNSSELLLIDPHFDPSKDRWRPVVKACIELAGQAEHERPNVTMHTLRRGGDPVNDEDFRTLCMQHLPEMLSGRVFSVRVRRWLRRRTGGEDFHARYVLTDRGGYGLDKGLDQERGVTQVIRLLGEQEWTRVRRVYGEAERFFDADCDFEVTSPPDSPTLGGALAGTRRS